MLKLAAAMQHEDAAEIAIQLQTYDPGAAIQQPDPLEQLYMAHTRPALHVGICTDPAHMGPRS